MVRDLAGCVEHQPTNAPTVLARLHVLAVLGPWAITATVNPQKKTGENLTQSPDPRTPRGTLAKIARILGVVKPQLSFRKSPVELVELIGDRVDDLLEPGETLPGLVEAANNEVLLLILAEVIKQHGDSDSADGGGEAPEPAPAAAGRKSPATTQKEPATGRGRGRGAAAEPEPEKAPARGRGPAKEPAAAAPGRGRGRGAPVETDEDDDDATPPEDDEQPPEDAAPARGGRGRGRGAAAEPEKAPVTQKSPVTGGRGRGRGAAAEEPAAADAPVRGRGGRGRGAAPAETENADKAPAGAAFDASVLEADIAALRVALEGKAEAKALASVLKTLETLQANVTALDAAVTLVLNEQFFVDAKGNLAAEAPESVLDIEDINAYVFPE